MYGILFTDLYMSNQPCLSWIKPTWPCWMIFLYVPVFSLLAFSLIFLHLCAPGIQAHNCVFWLWLYLVWNIRVILASCNEIVGNSFFFFFLFWWRISYISKFPGLEANMQQQYCFYILMGIYPQTNFRLFICNWNNYHRNT